MTHIQQRRDQAAIWTSVNPVLFDGESGHESDTGREKMGDGVTAWVDLPYKYGVDSVAGRTGAVVLGVADVSGAAPSASPALTGTPTAPTPVNSDADTSIATTAFVHNVLGSSPVLGGNPTAPTPASSDNDTSIATTAFVQAHVQRIISVVTWDPNVTGYAGPLIRDGGIVNFQFSLSPNLDWPANSWPLSIIPVGFRPVVGWDMLLYRTQGTPTPVPCHIEPDTGYIVPRFIIPAGTVLGGSVSFPGVL